MRVKEFALLEIHTMTKITYDDYESHTHDGMNAKIIHVRCHYDERIGVLIDERFDVELDITDNVGIDNTFDTLYGARMWIVEQFGFPRSILILKHSE